MGASAALADDNRYYDSVLQGLAGLAQDLQDNNRYYNNDYYDNGGNNRRYQYRDNGSYSDYLRQRDWNNGGYDYRWDVVSPRSIVRNLQRNDYRNISRPVLSGNFYQVKAINPDGRRVKLYIDPYSGRIAKVKS
jgi:hypothetical protein